MRIASFLRVGTLALALAAAVTSVTPAFAATSCNPSQPQISQHSNTGPYDGSSFRAAKSAALWGY